MKIWISLLGMLVMSFSQASTLVIGTTFSPESTQHITAKWQQISPQNSVRTINRTSNSLEYLVNQSQLEHLDLILSSSPILFHHLAEQQMLFNLPEQIQSSLKMPEKLRQTTAIIGFSGYGIFYNHHRLQQLNLEPPKDWQDLFNPKYRNSLMISSPSRSGTHAIMLEMLFQQQGWETGWQYLLTLSGNLSLISSRSFSVSEKVKMGLATAGITIDSYANHLLTDKNLGFHYFPQNIASPTFIAIPKNSKNKEQALNFIAFLLGDEGQKLLAEAKMDKYPLKKLNSNHALYQQQQNLLAQPPLDYEKLFLRAFLVQHLFDVAISFRLNQLKEVWNLIEEKEQKSQLKLTAIRQLISEIPISTQQSLDIHYLTQLKQDKKFLLEQEKQWAAFFEQRTQQALILLGEIK